MSKNNQISIFLSQFQLISTRYAPVRKCCLCIIMLCSVDTGLLNHIASSEIDLVGSPEYLLTGYSAQVLTIWHKNKSLVLLVVYQSKEHQIPLRFNTSIR